MRTKIIGITGLFLGIAVGLLAGLAAFGIYLSGGKPAAQQSNVVRASSVPPPCMQPPGWLREFRFAPDCIGAATAGTTTNTMRFNSLGFRDVEHGEYPQKDVYRILVLGASNVLGVGVPQEKTLTRLLEGDLTNNLKRKFEVINAATSGYCAWQSAFRLRELLERLHPDLVLYHIGFPNCFMGDQAWESRLVFDDKGNPLGFDRSLLGVNTRFSWINSIYFHPAGFYLFYTLHDSIRRLALSWRLRRDGGTRAENAVLSSTKSALGYMNRTALAHGSFFIGFYFPSPEPVLNQVVPVVQYAGLSAAFARLQPSVKISNDAMAFALKKSGLPILPLRQFSYISLPDDYHLGVVGMEAWSRRLAEDLASSFPLRKGSRPREMKFNPDFGF